MNKSILTNLISVAITIYGLVSPIYSTEIFMAGLFALSGGLTNWIAIHMLFEKYLFFMVLVLYLTDSKILKMELKT